MSGETAETILNENAHGAFLSKPFMPPTLLTCVRRLLTSEEFKGYLPGVGSSLITAASGARFRRQDDLDYHFIRASMVVFFLFFGYQKWSNYEAQGLIRYIGRGPLIFWMYPVFGIRSTTCHARGQAHLRGALLRGDGTPQIAQEAPPDPSGATGFDTSSVML